MRDDHEDDTADRDERPIEGPEGEPEVSLEDVFPLLRSTGRRPPEDDTTTSR